MDAVDKADAAQFTLDEILDPDGWVLLNFLMDPRTGLGRFRDFRISNYQLMMQLIDVCTTMTRRGDPRARRTSTSASSSTASTPSRRASRSCAAPPCTATSWCSTSATRRSSTPTNRFMVYALFPQCNISIHVLWGLQAAEHRVRDRQVDPRPLERDERRRADARATAAAATRRPAPARSRTRTPPRCWRS